MLLFSLVYNVNLHEGKNAADNVSHLKEIVEAIKKAYLRVEQHIRHANDAEQEVTCAKMF